MALPRRTSSNVTVRRDDVMSPAEFVGRRPLRRAVEIAQTDVELWSWELKELQALFALGRADVIESTATERCGGS